MKKEILIGILILFCCAANKDFISLGYSNLNKLKYAEALTCFNSALEKDTTYPALFGLIRSNQKLGNESEMVKLCKMGLILYPNELGPKHLLIQYYFDKCKEYQNIDKQKAFGYLDSSDIIIKEIKEIDEMVRKERAKPGRNK